MNKIALLLSGGVDSSVALHLLCQANEKPDCFYIHIGPDKDDTYSCTSDEDVEMCRAVTARYGVNFDIIDLHKEYWDNVVQYTMDTIKKGYTPNPDVMCNTLIKFGAFYDKIGYKYDYIATGHYATRVGYWGIEKPEWWIGPAKDPIKDQVDFIANINTSKIPVSKILFPIGRLTKEEVRQIAEENHLINAKRKDSQGICFLGKINYNDYIEQYLGRKEGDIVDIDTGDILGKHQGYWFHTIGQRKGLGLSGGPWYVVGKDIKQNVVYVSKDMNRNAVNEFAIGNINWLTSNLIDVYNSFKYIDSDIICNVAFKIRHTPQIFYGKLRYVGDTQKLVIETDEPITVAPGQFCILYDDTYSHCYGCGEISL